MSHPKSNLQSIYNKTTHKLHHKPIPILKVSYVTKQSSTSKTTRGATPKHLSIWPNITDKSRKTLLTSPTLHMHTFQVLFIKQTKRKQEKKARLASPTSCSNPSRTYTSRSLFLSSPRNIGCTGFEHILSH